MLVVSFAQVNITHISFREGKNSSKGAFAGMQANHFGFPKEPFGEKFAKEPFFFSAKNI